MERKGIVRIELEIKRHDADGVFHGSMAFAAAKAGEAGAGVW